MNSIKNIAIIGSGNIGRSFALLFAKKNYSVNIYDSNPEQLKDALKSIENQISKETISDSILGKIHIVENFEECIKDADYIQECVLEDVEIKRSVFEKMDPIVGDDVILASSTSCIPPEEFTFDLKHRTQIIVVHPFNPPNYIRAVEVVPGPSTTHQVIATTCNLLRHIGQIPIVVNTKLYGFAFVRIQYAIINECWRLVEDEVVSVEDVDTIISEGLGRLYSCIGPFEHIHLSEENEGFKDHCDRYAVTFSKIVNSFSGPVKMEGATAIHIHQQLCKKFPLVSMSEHKLWRDKRLAALANLKKEWS